MKGQFNVVAGEGVSDTRRGRELTFLCSDAVLGLSGVVFMLAGVAATGEAEVFSIMSAGIVPPK